MEIRQPTEKEMIEGIAKGFKEFLVERDWVFGSDLRNHKIWEAIKLGVRDAFSEEDISRYTAESIASQKTADQETISWISVNDELPPLLETVLVHRIGGVGDLDVVGIAYRRNRISDHNNWGWCETGATQTYWGFAADGSQIISWAKMPNGFSNK